MKSHEAIQASIAGKTVEHAKRLHKSVSMLSKWQEPTGDYTDSGAHNPLDRIETIVETALSLGTPFDDATAPIKYLEERFNIIGIRSVCCNDPKCDAGTELMKTCTEFGELAKEASEALADGKISRDEYKRIERETWHLIRQATQFLHKAKEVMR